MAHPEDDLDRAPEMRSKCVHTQESGYEGLSSNMKHKCYDDSVKKAQPVDKDSFVKPIPKEEDELEVGKGSPGEQVSVLEPTLVSDDNEEEEESLKEPIEEHTTKALKDQTSSSVQRSKGHIAAATSEGVTVVTGSSNVATKMVQRNGRLSYKRRARRNLVLWVCLFRYLCPTGAFPAERVKCFTCNYMERCLKVGKIFDQRDEGVFYRKETVPLPLCAGTPEPDSNTCNVCRYQQNIHIYCSSDITRIEAEDDRSLNLGHIPNITEGCVPLESSDPGLNNGKSIAAVSAPSLHGVGILGVPVFCVTILLAFCLW